jgi:hypothetical protein
LKDVDPIPTTENRILLPTISIFTAGAVVDAEPTNPLSAVTIPLKVILFVDVLIPTNSPS